MIKSNDCILTFALDGENYFPVYCGTGFALTVDTEIVETTTKGDGQYQDFDYNSLSYNLTIDGLGKLDTYSTFDVLFAQRTYADVPFRLICSEGDLVQVIEGTVIVLSTDLKVTAGEHLNYSHQFRGRGPYEIRDFLEYCLTEIGSEFLDVSYTLSEGDAIVSINSVTGPWASFNYSVSGGPSGNATTNPFVISGLLPGSFNSVTITPVCESGQPGIGVTTEIVIPF